MELLGDGAWCPFPYRMAVHSGDWHYFHRRIGEETFVRLAEGFDAEMALVDRNLRVPRKAEQQVAGDPVQQAAVQGRGAEPAGPDKKDIAHSAFGQL